MRGYPKNPVSCAQCESPWGAPGDGLCSRCRAKLHRPRQVKYPFRPEDDEYLRRVYAEHSHSKPALSSSIGAFAKRLRYPRHFITIRAQVLGLTRKQCQRKWTEDELARLRDLVGVKRPQIIAKLMHRSYESVLNRMRRLHVSARLTEGYSRDDAATVLGVSPGTVYQWINAGLLRVKPQSNRISEREMQRFLRIYPEKYDLRCVDQAWFKGMVFPAFGLKEARTEPERLRA